MSCQLITTTIQLIYPLEHVIVLRIDSRINKHEPRVRCILGLTKMKSFFIMMYTYSGHLPSKRCQLNRIKRQQKNSHRSVGREALSFPFAFFPPYLFYMFCFLIIVSFLYHPRFQTDDWIS